MFEHRTIDFFVGHILYILFSLFSTFFELEKIAGFKQLLIIFVKFCWSNLLFTQFYLLHK
jgi:hypothetical protein